VTPLPERVTHDDWAADLRRRVVREHGLRVIACGDDAVLLGSPRCPWVVRLCQNGDDYDAFLGFCGRYPSPHLPRVVLHWARGEMRVTVLEKLVPIDPGCDELWARINRFAALAYGARDGRPLDFSTLAAQESDPLAHLGIALGVEARRVDKALDLSCHNIMLRPTSGEIVITDPWCAWAS